MTWSIIARDRDTGQFGIAVATRFFAGGALVPHVKSRIGAIATQALVNPFYGTEGLRLLAQGESAQDVVSGLIGADAGRDHRQVHVMDALGRSAAHTGAACVDWCGHIADDSISVAGNMLAGERVLAETVATYRRNIALPLPRRLVAALRAGEAAGGDRRGKQSAALVVCRDEEWPELDLRVDDHPDPLAELARLEQVSREQFTPFMRLLPSRRDPVGVIDRGAIEAEMAKAAAEGRRFVVSMNWAARRSRSLLALLARLPCVSRRQREWRAHTRNIDNTSAGGER